MENSHLGCGAGGHLACRGICEPGETPGCPTGKMPVLRSCASQQLIQSRNIQLQVEAFDAGETAFDVAGEQFGIFGSELFIGQCCYRSAVAFDD